MLSSQQWYACIFRPAKQCLCGLVLYRTRKKPESLTCENPQTDGRLHTVVGRVCPSPFWLGQDVFLGPFLELDIHGEGLFVEEWHSPLPDLLTSCLGRICRGYNVCVRLGAFQDHRPSVLP
jgi:hypothetical protein